VPIPPHPAVELVVATTWDGWPAPAHEQVRLRLRLTSRHLRIAVSAPFHGDEPPAGEPGPTDRLWEHEVVELFVASAADEPAPTGAAIESDEGARSSIAYTEVELSPWGHHLVLRLAGARRVVAAGLPLAYRVRRSGSRWVGAARLARHLLPPLPWRANAYAIHGEGRGRRYLAATALPGERPDFHQPGRFPALRLPPQ
jgi:hypothetical protein